MVIKGRGRGGCREGSTPSSSAFPPVTEEEMEKGEGREMTGGDVGEWAGGRGEVELGRRNGPKALKAALLLFINKR